MVTTPVFEHLFNIGQGLKSFDTSGNHRHSVLSGNPSWVNGRKGKAIALDGVDDAFVAPVTENVNEDFTVAFWVQNWVPGSDGAGLGILALQSAPDIHTSNNTVIIYKDSITGEVKVICYTSGYTQQILSSGSTTKSGFMCIRRNGATVNFFLNGAFVAERTVTEIREFTWLLVGLTSYNYTKADWIDKIRYWDSALSDEEIEYWYAKDKPRWNDSCVLWLRGDEENGTAVKDYSPQGNDGTLTAAINNGTINGASYTVDAEKGKCLSFDGVNDTVPIPSFIQGTYTPSSFTVCFDVKIDASLNKYSAIIIPSGSGVVWWVVMYNFFNGQLFFTAYDGTLNPTTYFIPEKGRWYHVAYVLEAGVSVKCYVDGVLMQTVPTTLSDLSAGVRTLRLGAQGWHSSDNGYFKGLLCNLRIYNRALNQTEISALYNRTSEVSYGCVGKWLLNEGSGLTAYDSHNRFTAKRGNGLNFNGVNEIIVGSSAPFSFEDTTFTVNVCIKNTFAFTQHILSQGAYTNAGFSVGISDGKPFVGCKGGVISGFSFTASGSIYINDGELHFITYVLTTSTSVIGDNTVKIFVDGVEDTGVSISQVTVYSGSPYAWAVGARDSSLPRDWFKGNIDEVLVFTRALTASEVSRLYEADGFLDYIPLRIQDGSLVVSVDSVGVQWDSWANGACRRKHLGLGKNVAYTFTAIEETADVPWLDSAAYILKEKKDSGTPVDLYIKKTDVLAAESTSVVIDSMNVRYSPTMQVRYIDFSVREQ